MPSHDLPPNAPSTQRTWLSLYPPHTYATPYQAGPARTNPAPEQKSEKLPDSHNYSYNISHTYITFSIAYTLYTLVNQLDPIHTLPLMQALSPIYGAGALLPTGVYPSVQACRCVHTHPRGGVRTGTGMAILSILSIIPTLSIISISITQATFICYIKGDKVMCYIERKSPPAPAPRGRPGTRTAPLSGWVHTT